MEVSLVEHPSITERATVETIVNPCQVSSLTGKATPSFLNYNVGSGEFTSFELSFVQELACNYTVNVAMVTPLPEFLAYRDDTKDFSILSQDITHAGKATYTLRASVEVPKDLAQAEKVTIETKISFDLEVVAGCD